MTARWHRATNPIAVRGRYRTRRPPPRRSWRRKARRDRSFPPDVGDQGEVDHPREEDECPDREQVSSRLIRLGGRRPCGCVEVSMIGFLVTGARRTNPSDRLISIDRDEKSAYGTAIESVKKLTGRKRTDATRRRSSALDSGESHRVPGYRRRHPRVADEDGGPNGNEAERHRDCERRFHGEARPDVLADDAVRVVREV